MRTIIAGSRSITEYDTLLSAIEEIDFEITTVISGGAKGVDSLGEWFAEDNGIPLEIFPADWARFGRSAGYIRNQEMADNAEACLILWDGKSKGSLHMNNIAVKKGLKVHLCKLN